MAWTENLLDLFDHPCLISKCSATAFITSRSMCAVLFPIPFTELLSVPWKKKFNESVIFMSDLLCCFFCVFEVNSVKILLPLKFQGSELNLFAHANVLNFGLPIHYICWWWCPHPLLEVGCPVNECYTCTTLSTHWKGFWTLSLGTCMLTAFGTKRQWFTIYFDNYRIRTCAGNPQ